MVKKWFFYFLTPIAVAVLIAACGGGGGGAPPAPTPVGGVATAAHNEPALSAGELTALAAGGLYFNVHSMANPNGEIRGQLDPGAVVTVRTATLDAAQEEPAPVGNPMGTGKGAVVVDDATLEISGGFTFTGLSGNATAAHIHLGAATMAGPVIIPLTLVNDAMGAPFAAIVPGGTVLTQEQLTELNNGNLYFNVHTAANPNGEIRGQLTGTTGFSAAVATLTGADEVPPVTTSATGKAALVVDTVGNIIIAAETFDGMISPTASHIHQAPAGVNGDVIVPLIFGPLQ